MILGDILDNVETYRNHLYIRIYDYKTGKYIVDSKWEDLSIVSRQEYMERKVLYMYAAEVDYDPVVVFEIER